MVIEFIEVVVVVKLFSAVVVGRSGQKNICHDGSSGGGSGVGGGGGWRQWESKKMW